MKKRELFKSKSLYTGTWISVGSPVITELACCYPFDWILIDYEHGNSTEFNLPEMLRASTSETISTIVRVANLEINKISRILDWGADGVMMPRIESAEEAVKCISAMRYTPYGNRGYSSSVRAFRYGTEDKKYVIDEIPFFFAQIETFRGVRNIDEIAKVDGVDTLFIGPSDLKLDLKNNPDADNYSFELAIQRVVDAARVNNKKVGIFLRNYDQISHFKSIGFDCFAFNSDIGILRDGYTNTIKLISRLRI